MRSDYQSMKKFEVRCDWWRPENPSQRIPGSAGFDGKDLVVRLDQWFGSMAEIFMRSLPIEILHGETLDGVPINVLNSYAGRSGSGVDLIVNSIAVGTHLSSAQEFISASATLNGLDDWRRANCINITYANDGSTTVQCSPPSSRVIEVPDRSASIALQQSIHQLGGGRKIEIRYDSSFGIEPNQPKQIDWFNEIVYEMCQLIGLFINQPCELTSLRLTPVGQGHDDEQVVEWYWNRRDSEVREIGPTQIVIRFPDVESQFEEIVRNWLSKTEKLQYSRALFFSAQGSPAPFLENRFLPIIQAVEVYCRSQGSEKYIPDADFEEIKQKLLDDIPGDLDAGLTQKLRTSIGFANELSLGDRIRQLLGSLEVSTRRFVCQNEEKFARILKDTRNYYTHYGIPKKKALTGVELHWATEQTSLLLKILMLKECGLSEALIQKSLDQSGHISQGMKIWAEIEKNL